MITHLVHEDPQGHAFAELWFAAGSGWTLWLGQEHRTLRDFERLIAWGKNFGTPAQGQFIDQLASRARTLPGFPSPVFGPGYQDIQLAGGGERCGTCGDGDHVELSITFGLMWTYTASFGCTGGFSGTAECSADLIKELKKLRKEYSSSPQIAEVITGAITAHTALMTNAEATAFIGALQQGAEHDC